MYLHHDEIKVMLEEHHKDLIAQSYLIQQLEEVGRNQGRPGVYWSMQSIINILKTILAIPKISSHPTIRSAACQDSLDCQTQPNCQSC
jgi:hypothetical protein